MTDGAHAISGSYAETAERHHPEHLSVVLRRLAATGSDKISVRDIAIALQDRSFGAFLLVFALPNLVPLPPGATLIIGLPLVFVAWQMLASPHGRVVLPKRIGDYRIDRQTFELIVRRLGPWLQWAENWVRPRFWFLESRSAERLLGIYALILAVVVVLPIPLGNWPPAFALAIIGFAHSERDGLGVLAGCVIGLATIALAGFVVFTAGALLNLVF
ncbi:exopolysaccharide biosynthesis protein [Ciceribacter sp. L1K23]|uniref:exopolysaccharide biosynthesis protein n=1 Tax=Ciceribacter sp. L1K23 TaxID=2820276 RepID=UPI001B83722F|nr:exopolysaccharide biosynthesis protein [Ciceribacter sp. L1K23]MBR0555519.1 exopolysaccharide biosynthesis protein [Ciceribacter sp. L1K23]